MSDRSSGLSGGVIATSILTALASMLLFIASMAPTIGWGDSADLALRTSGASDGEFVGTTRDYVLFRAVVSPFQLIPVGDAGTRANLATGFFGAVSVGLVAFLAGLVTGSRASAAGAGIALAVSHTFWLLSVTAEVYTFNLTLVLAVFAAMALWWRTGRQSWLIAAALFGGLALTHHASGLLLALAVLPMPLMGRGRLAWSGTSWALAVWVGASLPYWLGVGGRLSSGTSSLAALQLGAPGNVFFDANPLREGLKFLGYCGYNFAGLGLPFIVSGLYLSIQARRTELMAPIIWATLLIGGGVNSSIPDKFNVYVMAYPSLAIVLGVTLAHLRAAEVHARSRARVGTMVALLGLLCAGPVVTYRATVWASRQLGVDLVGARHVPYRDNANYFLWPPKNGDYGPRRYAMEALSAALPGSLVIADYTLWRPLRFMQQAEGVRPDVEVVFVERLLRKGVAAAIEQQIDARPVYLATNIPPAYYQLNDVERAFTLEPVGVIFRVQRK